jgi:hypothetical protein
MDLPPAEMAAVQALRKAEGEGKIENVTSRETWREQDKAKNPTVREQLVQSRGETPVVPKDHTLLGIHRRPPPDERGSQWLRPVCDH